MPRHCIALFALLIVAPAFSLEPFPSSFHTQEVNTNGTTLHVRISGEGPAVIMLHGFGDTGDMWAPAAAVLVKNHTVVVPDLRGMGLSAHPDTGYTKKNQALDIAFADGGWRVLYYETSRRDDALREEAQELLVHNGWARWARELAE